MINSIYKDNMNLVSKLKDLFRAQIINRKFMRNQECGIISVIIDCDAYAFAQYLEPVVEELVNIPDHKFEFYFGETTKGMGSLYFCYKKQSAFSSTIYPRLKGKMIFLSSHIYPEGPPDALKIVLDHCICSVKQSFFPKRYVENYNIYCVTGKLYKDKVINGLKKYNLQDDVVVFETGYPKSDKIYNGKLPPSSDIFRKLALNPSKKTILYAPSWEKGLSMAEYGYELAQTICQDKNLNLIIKPHPCHLIRDNEFFNLGINWAEKFKTVVLFNSNCIFIENIAIDELLTISDIMITDISSAALEFLVLDKPVIYLDCPKFEETFKTMYAGFDNDISYSELLNNPACNAGRHVGLVNFDYTHILEDINYLLNNPDYKYNERKAYSEMLLSNKGSASKCCAAKIIDYFHNNYLAKEIQI